MNRDLAGYIEVTGGAPMSIFAACIRRISLRAAPPTRLAAWHLVGGLDPLDQCDLNGAPIADGLPVLLRDWIDRDGLTCLKIKLRGNDAAWDYKRIVRVGRIALECRVPYLSADFNCTVTDPAYVNELLDQLAAEEADIDRLVLYVEQPFPYGLDEYPIDVRSVAARKPLFMDESAHSWQQVRHGRALGWTGVASRRAKRRPAPALAMWAKAHGMAVMVQDLPIRCLRRFRTF